MTPLNEFKTRYLKQLSQVSSLSNAWSTWQSLIDDKLSQSSGGKTAFDLGDHLREIFLSTSESGRSQSTVSGGGAAWECLITWYLNLIFWNTPIVAVRQNKKFVPQSISDCLTVTIANNQTNTESDILVFSIPNHSHLRGSSIEEMNLHLSSRLSDVDLVVLQCKTNWNDNSQIPMLWDMIYNSESRLKNVSVGVNGSSPESVKNFKYGFVTVPTVKVAKLKPSGVSVLRVKNLTGGNYWGMESKADIAASIKEFPNRHFPSHFDGGVVSHMQKQLSTSPEILDNFLNLNFD